MPCDVRARGSLWLASEGCTYVCEEAIMVKDGHGRPRTSEDHAADKRQIALYTVQHVPSKVSNRHSR